MSELEEIEAELKSPDFINKVSLPPYNFNNTDPKVKLIETENNTIFYNEDGLKCLKTFFQGIFKYLILDDISELKSIFKIINKNKNNKTKTPFNCDSNYNCYFEIGLLFLIFHELGHISLQHIITKNTTEEQKLQMEKEADNFAIKNLIDHYSLLYTFKESVIARAILIIFLSSGIIANQSDKTHPSIDERIENFLKIIKDKKYYNKIYDYYQKYKITF